MASLRIVLILLFLAGINLTGCANVAPWERGVLAKPEMALDPNPLQSYMRSHNFGSREAAANTNATGGGGGCGCF
ncbi:MAG: hypothetical protein NMNS01_23270 [Nitrosomonas sp.]|nr:MAG: hypothetical protein NMNS01_23270 [Nitrosomonas sp.]